MSLQAIKNGQEGNREEEENGGRRREERQDEQKKKWSGKINVRISKIKYVQRKEKKLEKNDKKDTEMKGARKKIQCRQ